MDEKFKTKTYGHCELAQLYFPKISNKSASVELRTWFQLNEKLKNEL
jgi:hypothetical protein